MPVNKSIVPPRVAEAIENLRRLTEVFQERLEALAASAGLSVSQWRVLEEITDEHFMPSVFARSRSRSPAAVSKVLRQLQDRGLIEASISSRDGRQRDYGITRRGNAVLQKLRGERERAIRAIWLDLPPEELEAFSRFSEKLTGRMAAYTDSGEKKE